MGKKERTKKELLRHIELKIQELNLLASVTLVNLSSIQIGQQSFHHQVFYPCVIRVSLNHEVVKTKSPETGLAKIV